MIANLLRRDGHWVVTAPDGEQGIATFEAAQQSSEPFDAVITDLGMPKVDGFSVARAIKALSPSTPVLLLSGWGFRLEGEEMHALIDGVLAKPATHQQLRRALFILRQRRENPSQKLGDD
jgi:DNA-binding response OmpR family regulator